MRTNIDIDNYEAYLLDYLEGNLSPDEAAQLKAFVVGQGMDWDELSEELPHLEVPAIAYQDKESLKKKAAVVPLYVKIAAAAAAAGLLLTVTLWPEKSLPQLEPVAELKPILPTRLITSEESQTIQPRTVSFVESQNAMKKQKPSLAKRAETTLLADMHPLNAKEIHIAIPASFSKEPDFDLIAYRTNADPLYALINDNHFAEEEEDLSLIDRGVFRLTGGNHSSFTDLLLSGLHTAKQEVSLAATDLAMSAYYRVDDHIEEAKERWEERREP